MGWRATQVEATRERIIEVFRELGSGSDAAAPTLAEVSRISGVSLATIHRHFRSRDDLVAAASVDRSFLGVERPDAWTFDDSRAHLVALWSDLAENMAMTRESRKARRAAPQEVLAVTAESVLDMGARPRQVKHRKPGRPQPETADCPEKVYHSPILRPRQNPKP